MTEPDDIEVYEPPTAARVAARSQVLSAQAYRATLELSATDPGAAEAHTECLAWCERVGLRSEFEAREWTLLTTPLGKLSRRDSVNASWLTEPALVMAWALGQFELPDYEEQADGADVANALRFLDDDAHLFWTRLERRSRAEIEDMHATYITLHWRLRQFTISPTHLDFVKFARECEWTNMRLDQVRLADDDLSIGGRPLATAPEIEWRTCLSIASERQRAAEWLLGQDPTYSHVTTDT